MLYLKSVSERGANYFHPDMYMQFTDNGLIYGSMVYSDYQLDLLQFEVWNSANNRTMIWNFKQTLFHVKSGGVACTFEDNMVFISSPFIESLFSKLDTNDLDKLSFVMRCLYIYGDGGNVEFFDNSKTVRFYYWNRYYDFNVRCSFDEFKRFLVKGILMG